MASDWNGVSIALGDSIFNANPSWTRIDTQVRCSRIEIRRGRQNEFERTDAGSATVVFNDPAGLLDPSDPGLGYIDARPLGIAIRDPVADEWFPLFRGGIEDWTYDLKGSQVSGQVTLQAIDGLAYLAGFEMAPGLAGDTENEFGHIIFQETAPGTVDVNDRIIQALTNAQWPAALSSVFTGNVRLMEGSYSPGESILQVIHDCADAEFPTVANLYVDRFGFVCFHGRMARFDPDSVAASATHWDFHRWRAGDGTAISSDPTRAQVRPPFFPTRSMSMVRNAALCYPKDIDGALIDEQVYTFPGSISAYGYRPWSATDLLLAEGVTTGNTANAEGRLYSQYMVENYADPRTRIDQITFRPLHPSDPRAAATWALITGVDISDAIDVQINHPGGGRVNEEFYVEGITYTIRPLHLDLDTGYPYVELTLDLSPVAYWLTSPF